MADELTITVHGNLTADPETRTYNDAGGGQNSVTSFSIANSPRKYNRNTGQYENGPSTFINCKAFGTLGERVAASLHKGDRVIVSGTFAQREYTNKQGEKRRSFELTATDVAASLLWSTAQVTRAHRNNSGGYSTPQQSATDDPWQ